MKKGEIYAIICLTKQKGATALIKFIKNIPNFIGIISYILYIVSLSMNISKGKGEPILNYILLAVSAVFLIIYIVMLLRGQDKKQVKSARRYYKWFKLGMKGISLFIIIYGFTTASGEDSSMLMPTILIILWIMQIHGEIRKHKARKRRERFKQKIDSFKNRNKKPEPIPEPTLTVAPVDTIEFLSEDFDTKNSAN